MPPPKLETRRFARISTLVAIVDEAVAEAEKNDAYSPVAAVTADWGRSGPTLAAITTFGHAFGKNAGDESLAVVAPGPPTAADRAALDILLDSLPPTIRIPRVILISEAQLAEYDLNLIFRPQDHDSDLLALADFSNTLHDRARQIESYN